MRYGLELMERRRNCYISRMKLSELSGIHYRTICMIEQGETISPRQSTINLLNRALEKQERIINRIRDGQKTN